jgi:enhancing lycopene biosynthesis protein 2
LECNSLFVYSISQTTICATANQVFISEDFICFGFQDVNEIAFDDRNLLVTTPAFMYEGQFHEIYDGIGNMIKKVVQLIK